MIPDDSAEVEMIETTEVVAVDIFIEQEPRGIVLTFGFDDRHEDIAVLLRPEGSRDLGDLLYRAGCTAQAHPG